MKTTALIINIYGRKRFEEITEIIEKYSNLEPYILEGEEVEEEDFENEEEFLEVKESNFENPQVWISVNSVSLPLLYDELEKYEEVSVIFEEEN